MTPFTDDPAAPILVVATHEKSQPEATSISIPFSDWPVRPKSVSDSEDYRLFLVGELQIGHYIVRKWWDTSMSPGIVTISDGNQILAQIEDQSVAIRHAGDDITGEGNPDLVLSTFNAGPFMARKTFVYDLGPTLTRVLELRPILCGDQVLSQGCPCYGYFADLDDDGFPEILACDSTAYHRWQIPVRSYECAIQQLVVLQYNEGEGYQPASHRFLDLYSSRLRFLKKLAKRETAARSQSRLGPPCAVTSLVLNHLYLGQPDLAWAELDRMYDAPDKPLWWMEFSQTAFSSEYYESVGNPPDVPLPEYYMLQLATHCGDGWREIAVLQDGQDACALGLYTWDSWWLARQLRAAALLVDGEGVTIEPSGCTSDCRLVAFRFGESAVHLGTIVLDASHGFPGEVFRVYTDGSESTHFRLRGDLTWEAVGS